MNARQKAKKLKKQIGTLKSDNDLMRRIIADSPAMQELYDAYNKPVFVTHSTMQFKEIRMKIIIDPDNYMADIEGIIERAKQSLAQKLSRDFFKDIKENITYEVDDKEMPPIITASIFIGKKE